MRVSQCAGVSLNTVGPMNSAQNMDPVRKPGTSIADASLRFQTTGSSVNQEEVSPSVLPVAYIRSISLLKKYIFLSDNYFQYLPS